jgi:hypothetical protein
VGQTAGAPTADASQPDVRPADQPNVAAPALSQEAVQHAREQWAAAVTPLAQQRAGGMLAFVDVEGVRFHDVDVRWHGPELRVGYFGIERLTAPAGAGAQIQEALEQAVAQVAQHVGAPAARVFVRTVVNARWRETLTARGYHPLIMEHATGFENVLSRRVFMAQSAAVNPAAPAGGAGAARSPATPGPQGPASAGLPPSGSTPSGSTPSGSTPSSSTPSATPAIQQPTPAGTTRRGTPSTPQLSTLQHGAPSRTTVAAPAFTPPGPKRVLDANDYHVKALNVGANLGKRIVTHKVSGETSLFKPAEGEQEIIGSTRGIAPRQRFRRAPAAAYLGREAGIATPSAEMVIWRDENGKEEIGSLQKWTREGRAAGGFTGDEYKRIAASQPKLDLDAFDFVIGNMDRNEWNWKVVLDPQTKAVLSVIAIDMDSSLPPGAERFTFGGPYPPYQEDLPPAISRVLYDRLRDMRTNRARIERELGEFLDKSEIDGMFARLDEVLAAVLNGRIKVR